MIDVVVIDSEQDASGVLLSMLEEINSTDFRIIGRGSNCKDAIQILREHRPHVLFLEVCLPDGSAFDFLSLYKSLPFHVVLFSKNKEHALHAFEHGALDFLLKPIDKSRLQRTLFKLLERVVYSGPASLSTQEDDLRCALQRKIPVHVGMRVLLLNVCDLVYLRSQDGNTVVRTKQQESFTIGRQLSDFDFLFKKPSVFMRANKTTIINLNAVTSYSKGLEYLAYLEDGTEVEISRRKKTELLKMLRFKGESEE